jgi:hypothetical protein
MAEQPQPNPFDMIQELNRAMYGDPASRSQGLFDKVDSLKTELGGKIDCVQRDVNLLRQDLEQVKSKKPNPTSWTVGYVSFCASGIFAVIAIFNLIPRTTILNIAPEMAAISAVVLAAVALHFFRTGFGWTGEK